MNVPDAEALLDGLDPQQRAVAEAVHGPVVVVAGAGTGKTRALTRRIAYGVAVGAYDASGVLAVTFTTRAATEMRQRLAALRVAGVATRTFHSAALAQVRYLWPRVYGRSFPEVHPNPTGLLADLATQADVPATPRDLATEISWAKVTNVAPDRYIERASAAQRRVAGVEAAQVARLYSAYVDALAAVDQVDLEDVLLAAVGTLSTQPGAARVVRQKYRWFTVDEFQDVSPLQLRLLECWLGVRDDVCVVGDPRQSIYAFAGARSSLLTTMHTRFPRATRLHLTRNYRSTPQVLEVASAVLGRTVLQEAVPHTDGPPPVGDPAVVALPELRSTRPDGRRVRLVEAEDQAGEAHEVVRLVSQLLADGLAPHAVAVLTRTQAQAAALSRALAARSIPVSTPGATVFYARPEVAQAMALLSAAARREQRDSVAQQPLGGVVRAVLGDAGWSEDVPGAQQTSSRWQAWAAIVGVADHLQASASGSVRLADLVAELRAQERGGREPPGTGVVVETLHATKGQQWPAVVIAGAHDGGLPLWTAVGRHAPWWAEAEERRLLYVGITRARDHLAITWSRHPTPGAPRRRPSRFLTGLLADPPSSVEILLRPGSPEA